MYVKWINTIRLCFSKKKSTGKWQGDSCLIYKTQKNKKNQAYELIWNFIFDIILTFIIFFKF
jgi:hypothetical protein